MNNHIHETLGAERRARALLQRENVTPKDAWEFSLAPDADAPALKAAARLAARWHAAVATTPAPKTSSWKLARDGRTTTGDIPPETSAWKTPLPAASPWVQHAAPSHPTLTCAQCREIDRRAIRDFAVPGISLMENAALGAVITATDMLPSHPAPRIAILAGGGNNGGDALAMARGFAALGFSFEVALLKPAASITGDAAINLALLRDLPVAPIHPFHDAPESLPAFLRNKTLIVDALLGTGFKGALAPAYRTAIDAVNASRVPTLALDLPSGLNGDDGSAAETAVRATRTVTFAAVKTGLIAPAAREYVGDLYLADIGAPHQCYPE